MRKRSPIVILIIVILVSVLSRSYAQVPPRFYWHSLTGGKAIPVIGMSMSGNANPLDPGRLVVPDANFKATVILPGFAQTFKFFERAASVAILVPTGRVSSEIIVAGKSLNANTSGFGDPLIEFNVNLIGPKAINSIPDLIRYEPGFSVDLVVDLTIPIGEYDNTQPLNIGQNRWYGRVASPILLQLGLWVPGRRTTLEVTPGLWIFGDNDDFVGSTMSTKPIFELEGHFTRDFHKDIWGSLDMVWTTGGVATIDGNAGEKLDMLGAGFTLGYHLNDNLQFTMGYLASINDSGPTDLKMDNFKISIVFGWHPLVEGIKRLEGN